MALTDNFLAFWELEEASGTRADATGRGNSLTATNSPANVSGKVGNAVQMNGGTFTALSRADNADLSGGDTDFTVGGWMYLDSLTNMVLASKYNTSGNQREYLLFYNQSDHATNNRFSWIVSSNGSAITTLDANNFGAASASTWYFVVAWHDSVNNQIGISVNNGTPNTSAYSSGVFDGTASFEIGRLLFGTTSIYGATARIDQVFFVRKVLTSTEITQMYNGGSGLSWAAMVALGGTLLRHPGMDGGMQNLLGGMRS